MHCFHSSPKAHLYKVSNIPTPGTAKRFLFAQQTFPSTTCRSFLLSVPNRFLTFKFELGICVFLCSNFIFTRKRASFPSSGSSSSLLGLSWYHSSEQIDHSIADEFESADIDTLRSLFLCLRARILHPALPFLDVHMANLLRGPGSGGKLL